MSHKRNALSRLLLAFCQLYGFTFTLLLIVRFIIGERPWLNDLTPIGILNSMFVLALVPAVFTVILCLLLRSPRSAALQLLPLVMFILHYGGNFVPQLGVTPISAQSELSDVLRVLSYNLYAGNNRYTQVIDIIRQADADVVALQELTEPAAALLAEEFAEDYPYQALHPVGMSVSGSGLLSRLPILEDAPYGDVMVQQQAVIEVGGQAVTLFNVHPPIPYLYGANSTLRSQVIERLLERAALAPGEVLLIGDFNMGDASEDYQRVRQAYGDAFKAVGSGFGLSFPDWSWRDHPLRWLPTLSRIDYIFYSDGFVPLEAWTSHTSGGSDHRPIFAAFRLESPQE